MHSQSQINHAYTKED